MFIRFQDALKFVLNNVEIKQLLYGDKINFIIIANSFWNVSNRLGPNNWPLQF